MLKRDRGVIEYETAKQIRCDIAHYKMLLEAIKDERARSAVRQLITELEDRVRERRKKRATVGSLA